MAVYKIFPEKDSTIYSQFPNMNTGLDEILEATETSFAYSDPNPQTSRFLIKFSSNEIMDVLDNKINTNVSWSAFLNLYIATSTGLISDTTLDCFPISGSWNMGTGRYLDEPTVTNGASWVWRTYSGSESWNTSSFGTGVTGSYNTNYAEAGGGTWYTGSPDMNNFNSDIYPISQSTTFGFYSSKDINMDITNIIKAWDSGSFANHGFIVKQREEFIYNKDVQPELKYFSRDTHTIYPPSIQFGWRDYSFNTGSSTLTIIDNPQSIISIAENPGIFYSESINRFRINTRPEYPIQLWQTSSVYTNNYYLPTSSYWALKDLDTNEYVIPFDNLYTQLSADATSSYFDMYMNGLEPERNYQILIKTTIGSSTIISDNKYYFKVING